MARGGERGQHEPVGVFPILLLILMGAVIAFLLLVQNVDRFSRYFGGAAFKIVFDAALVTGLVLFAAYLYTRIPGLRSTAVTW